VTSWETGDAESFTGYIGLAYREAKAKYRSDAEADLIGYLWSTLLGSMRTDVNRFNVEGEFGAIYVSLDPDTPVRELERTARLLADTSHPEDINARRILLTLDVHLVAVADLRDADECAEWGTTPERVTGDDRAHSQAVAREVREQREAIRYASATGTGENLAIFYDRLRPASRIDLIEVQPLKSGW
jgi:hypothetical protein